MTSGAGVMMLVADVDLAVVGGDDQHRAGRQHVEDVGDEAVDGAQLGVVELAEAVLVGHLVDALVVGVDERLAAAQQLGDLGDERGGDPVAGDAGAVEVGLGEAGVAELGPGDDRRPLAGEGVVDLDLVGRDAGPGVAAGGLPAQHVEHVAVDVHPVADDAVLARAAGRWRSR